MKCLRRVFACFCKKKGDQKDSDEPMIFDDSPRSVEEIQGRVAAGGEKELTDEEFFIKHEKHAKDIARLPWNSIKVYTAVCPEPQENYETRRKDDKKAKRSGGLGGWFGANDPRNFFEYTPSSIDPVKESLFLELLAIEEALKKERTKYCCQPVIVFTNNVDAASSLMSSRKPQNVSKNYQEKVAAIKRVMKQIPGGVEVKHVEGHIGIYGNEEAKKLATPSAVAKESEGSKKIGNFLEKKSAMGTPEWSMAKFVEHANEIAQLEWSKIVVYTAVNQETRRYSGWLGTHHPLNFVKTTSSEDFEESCLMAIKEALNMLRDSKYYHGELVCIVTNDVRFENFKGGEVPTDLPGSGKVEIEKLIDQLAGAVEFKFVGKDWQIPGDKKARALTIEHHDDCPEK